MKLAQGSTGIMLILSIISIVPLLLPLPFKFLSIPSFAFLLYLAWFFRDPFREIVEDDDMLYAPADGKVIMVDVLEEVPKIAIRMSPFNVHLIRMPTRGKLTEIIHKSGGHRSVYFEGAEQKNEQVLLRFQNGEIEFEILELTGAFARRISNWIKIGDECDQGQKIGIIRFGSQTNFQLKNGGTYERLVEVGTQVKAGITPIFRRLKD